MESKSQERNIESIVCPLGEIGPGNDRNSEGSRMYFSDDQGMTWCRSENEVLVRYRVGPELVAVSHCEEPAIVELTDGRIMLFGRTITGRLYRAFSSDRGNTWSEAEPTQLASSYSSCCFTNDEHVVISYTCTWHGLDGENRAADGTKVVIHPVKWLYET